MVTTHNSRTFDWHPRFDPMSRQYGIMRNIERAPEPTKKFWEPGPLLNQGKDGACVGFGWSGELGASPVRVTGINYPFAMALYNSAKRFDEYPGEDYEGSSVLGGAKACQKLGLIGEYNWAFGVNDVRVGIQVHGPVVIGIPWLDGMFDPRPSGLLEVNGSVVGGHCIYLTGYHPAMRLFRENWLKRYEVYRLRNSWGPWGKKSSGDAYVIAADLDRLLGQDGEACVPLQRMKEAA